MLTSCAGCRELGIVLLPALLVRCDADVTYGTVEWSCPCGALTVRQVARRLLELLVAAGARVERFPLSESDVARFGRLLADDEWVRCQLVCLTKGAGL